MDTHQPSRHERRRQQTRQLLIQTTLQLVLEKGYDAITIQEITDQADLGRGTFYIHFKDKEEVVWTAIQEMILEMEKEAHKRYAQVLPPQVEFYGLLNIFGHAEKNRDLYRVMFGAKGSALLTARLQDLLVEIFLYDIRNAPRPRDPTVNAPDEIVAQMITGLISRLIFWWLETPNNYTAEQMAAITYEVLYRKQPPTTEV
jgi:AcrR family transcriptional regulator